MTAQQFQKTIQPVSEHGITTYNLYLDNQYVGWAPSYVDGETTLDRLIHDQISGNQSLDDTIAETMQQFRDAKNAGLDVLAETHRAALLDLMAARHGITVDELLAGYAEYKAEAA